MRWEKIRIPLGENCLDSPEMARKLISDFFIYFYPPSTTCAPKNFQGGVNGGLIKMSSMRRLGSEDPHRRQWKLFYPLLNSLKSKSITPEQDRNVGLCTNIIK